MRKRFSHMLDSSGLSRNSELFFLSMCFSIGITMGCLLASYLGENAQSHLSTYLDSYFTVLRDGKMILPSLFSTVWEFCRWPLLVFLFGFTVLGVIVLPLIFFVRGFLLSFSVAVFVRLFGSSGLLAALAIFGVSSFLVVPALFLLGIGALQTSKSFAGVFSRESKRNSPLYSDYFMRAGSCALLLTAGVLLQNWVTPILLQEVAALVS